MRVSRLCEDAVAKDLNHQSRSLINDLSAASLNTKRRRKTTATASTPQTTFIGNKDGRWQFLSSWEELHLSCKQILQLMCRAAAPRFYGNNMFTTFILLIQTVVVFTDVHVTLVDVMHITSVYVFMNSWIRWIHVWTDGIISKFIIFHVSVPRCSRPVPPDKYTDEQLTH